MKHLKQRILLAALLAAAVLGVTGCSTLGLPSTGLEQLIMSDLEEGSEDFKEFTNDLRRAAESEKKRKGFNDSADENNQIPEYAENVKTKKLDDHELYGETAEYETTEERAQEEYEEFLRQNPGSTECAGSTCYAQSEGCTSGGTCSTFGYRPTGDGGALVMRGNK